jgi:protein-tyrosine phosphatase
MGFFHFRIKKYIEVRVADIVPIKKALGYTALLKGIVYSERNNERGTLHQKALKEGMLFATQPLTEDGWEEFPQNQLMVYKDGDLVYAGKKHDHTYVHNEERMKLLYLAYAGL